MNADDELARLERDLSGRTPEVRDLLLHCDPLELARAAASHQAADAVRRAKAGDRTQVARAERLLALLDRLDATA